MRENLEQVLKSLITKAKEDGEITTEEQKLLDMVNTKLQNLNEELDTVLVDDIITYEEKDKLRSIRTDLMSEVFEIANSDDTITKDEEALLNLHSRTHSKFKILNPLIFSLHQKEYLL